ncbi:hypothetical protein DMP23_12310 [Amycolatopsis sp. A1MSW2902]
MKDFHGKPGVAVVTGGTGGLGSAICRALAARGSAVAFTYRSDHEAAKRLAAELEATADPLDLTDARQTKAYIERFGAIHTLVHAAPPPATIACCGSIPPITAAITGSFTASAVAVAGAPSSSRATIVASISTCPISSVAVSMIRSLYLPSMRQFQPWNRYCMVTVISPYAPPISSWSLCA